MSNTPEDKIGEHIENEENGTYYIPVMLKINAAKVISDPPEWLGNTIVENRKDLEERLQIWANSTDEGKRLMTLAQEYQNARKEIFRMQIWDKDKRKSETFSKERAKEVMSRIQEIRSKISLKVGHLTERGLEDVFKWIMQQED